MINRVSSSAGNVVSMTTNLEIRDVLKIKNIRKQKKMTLKKIGEHYYCGRKDM